MTRHRSLFAIARKNLLESAGRPDPDDPFRPLGLQDRPPRRRPSPLGDPLTLAAPVGPAARNRPDDLGRVATALSETGFLDRPDRPDRPDRIDSRFGQNAVFGGRMEAAVRGFQRRHDLRVDGLLNPGGPTAAALGRVLAGRTPTLGGLSGAAVAANARLVRHLMTTTADGMVPDLMAGDFRHGREGRAKTADFLAQLFARDPARARSLRAKARAIMEADERRRLDRLILQARLADEEPTPDDPGQDDPEESGDPPYDPEHPQPGDPDDPGEDEPEEPEEPEPDKEKCNQLSQALKDAEADLRGVQSLHDGAQKAVNEKTGEVERKNAAYEKALAAFAVENGIALWEIRKGRLPRGIQLPSDVHRAKEAYETARAESKILIDEVRRARDQLEQARERVSELREQLDAAGCGN